MWLKEQKRGIEPRFPYNPNIVNTLCLLNVSFIQLAASIAISADFPPLNMASFFYTPIALYLFQFRQMGRNKAHVLLLYLQNRNHTNHCHLCK